MFPFPTRRRNRQAEQDAASVMRPGWQRGLFMAMLLCFMVVVWWRHFDNRLTDIQARSAFLDETGSWTDEDRRALARRAIVFREEWGIRLVAHVRDAVPLLPEDMSRTTLFVGLDPAGKQALLVLPSLASQALKVESAAQGRDVRLALEEELALCLHDAPSATCLMTTLDRLQALLAGI